MSLELAIKENTSAVKALTEIWAKLAAQGNAVAARAVEKNAAGEDYNLTAGGVPIAEIKASTPKPAAEKTAPATTPAATAPAPTETATPTPAAESPSDAGDNTADDNTADDEVVDLALLTKETTGAATRNRAALVALLGEFNAKRASEIPEAQWGAFVAKLRSL